MLDLRVTSDFGRCVWQHRTQAPESFTKRHGLTRLVWYGTYPDIHEAIQRERTKKH